jgi:hypothetical protein
MHPPESTRARQSAIFGRPDWMARVRTADADLVRRYWSF